MKKRRNLPVFKNALVIDLGAEGNAIAKVDNLVVFIGNAVPEDIVDIQVTRKKRSYLEGKVTKYHKYSDKRIEPVCEHFGVCGGCKWQNISYETQLFYKQKQVEDSLRRIGHLSPVLSEGEGEPSRELSPSKKRGSGGVLKAQLGNLSKNVTIMPIIPSKRTEYYRNKLEFTFSNKRWLTKDEINTISPLRQLAERGLGGEVNALGFHIPRRFDKVLDINHCHLQKNPSNAIRLAVKEYAINNKLTFFDIRKQEGFLRNLIIRISTSPVLPPDGGEGEPSLVKPPSLNGGILVIISFFYEDAEQRENLLNHLADKFPEITSLMYVINPKKNDTISDLDIKTFKGSDCIYEKIGHLRFKIGAKSFFQTNIEQACELYNVVSDFAQLSGEETVYDLYTGSGTIADYIADKAKKVVGLEYLQEAVEDARVNSEINGITNTSFYAGDIKDILNEDFIDRNGTPDVIITDPPRAGMHKDVVKKILEIAPEKIVYVSCNPATQARDIALLSEKYIVSKIQPIDMFPHTPHVENVVLLVRN
ncbi:MAG: 23S rRNA (uracil(1939)-C(5))-methyltransferase RlmD [Bacteroidota bacterium]